MNNVQQRFGWSATDTSGVCTYDFYYEYAGMAPVTVLRLTKQTHYTVLHGDYNGYFGGGTFQIAGRLISARDCAGNVSTVRIPANLVATQEDGAMLSGEPSTAASLPTPDVGQTTCACALNGAMRRATAKMPLFHSCGPMPLMTTSRW